MTMPAPPLLLPGLLCDHRIWSAQLPALSDFAPVAVQGYGDARHIVEMARRALDQAPPRFSLVGHSMGARVALEIWRMAPERVERLALLDTGTHLPRPGEAEKRHALLALGRREGVDALLDAWLPPMVAPAHREMPAIMDPLRAMCRDAGVDSYDAQIAALLDRPEVESLLPTITCPVLLGVGALDEWSPVAQHEHMAAHIPHARLVIFEGSGHMAPVEAADQVTAALRAWLEHKNP